MRESEMPKTNFTVKYDGPALADHEMDIALLAPALLGMQKVLDELVTVSSGNEYKASLKMKGNAIAGSIEIELLIQAVSNSQNLKDLVVSFFNTKEVVASCNFIALMGGLFALVKKFGPAKPKKIETLENGDIKIQIKNEIVIVNQYVYKVYNNFEVREAIYKTVKPLEEEGIETFKILDGTKEIAQVDKEYVGRFIPPSVQDRLLVNEEVTYLQIVKVSFNMNNKWEFTQGDNKISANIIDSDFINKVQNRTVSFYDGDILKVRLQKEQYQTKGKLKTNYLILEVLEHIQSPRQQNLELK